MQRPPFSSRRPPHALKTLTCSSSSHSISPSAFTTIMIPSKTTCLRLLPFISFSLILSLAFSSPLHHFHQQPNLLHQVTSRQSSPSVIPVPDLSISPSPPPSPSSSLPPPPSPPPSPPSSPLPSPPLPNVTPSSSPSSSITPSPSVSQPINDNNNGTGTTAIPPTDQDSDGDDDGGGGLSGGAIAGIVIGALVALLALILCILLAVRRSRDNNQNAPHDSTTGGPAVYSSSDAAATPPPPPPPAVVPPPPPFAKDEARNLSPDAAADAAAAAAAAQAAAERDAMSPGDNNNTGGGGDTIGADDAIIPVPNVARGPTPPPHDYVLGAGPAATRSDFDHLHARFEREEIGDNSAVLGVDRSTITDNPDTTPIVGLPAPSTQSAIEPQSTLEQQQQSITDNPSNLATFETQEQVVGGDGSGAISNAAGPPAATIAEEGGDVPSLERDDPIEMSRERGTPF